jgi:hypothetical protein
LTVRKLYAIITRRLLVWSGFSVVSGLLALVTGLPFWRGFGIQAVAWGVVDALVALLGDRSARRRQARQGDALEPTELRREERSLRRLLWFNAGLDVLYVAGGVALALILGRKGAAWRGHGWGIVIQGAFLLAFDAFHARLVPRTGQ